MLLGVFSHRDHSHLEPQVRARAQVVGPLVEAGRAIRVAVDPEGRAQAARDGRAVGEPDGIAHRPVEGEAHDEGSLVESRVHFLDLRLHPSGGRVLHGDHGRAGPPVEEGRALDQGHERNREECFVHGPRLARAARSPVGRSARTEGASGFERDELGPLRDATIARRAPAGVAPEPGQQEGP